MGQDARADGSAVTQEREPQEIRKEIEDTRHELGDTVASLAEKADVKAQTKHKVEETKASISEKSEDVLGKAKSTSPEGAGRLASDALRKAREHAVPLATGGALIAGFLIGRARPRAG
jgi:chromosome segregation ATPase